MTSTPGLRTNAILTEKRTERLHARIWERSASVRKSLANAVEANGDTPVGHLSHGSAHISVLADGVRRNVLFVSGFLFAGVLVAFSLSAFSAGFASAIVQLAPPELPRLAVWPVVALAVIGLLVTVSAAAWAMRTLLLPNVDDFAPVPRRLIEASAYAIAVGDKCVYVGTIDKGVAKVREISYVALGRVEVMADGLALKDRLGLPLARVERCFDAGDEAEHHAVISFLREKARG